MELLAGATTGFVDAVARVDVHDWDALTPCEVKVSSVVEHVVAGNLLAVRLITGRTHDLSSLLRTDPVEAVRRSCRAQFEAFANADQRQPLEHVVRKLDCQVFQRARIRELVVHTWDIAKAARLRFDLEPDVLEGLWLMVHPSLAAWRVIDDDGTVGAPSIPPNWPTVDRVLAALGRAPESTRQPVPGPRTAEEPVLPPRRREPVGWPEPLGA